MAEKTLLLIDSYALLYRAYYAMPPTLTTRSGEPINAVLGFSSLLIDVLLKFQPTNCIAVMDSRGPTIRHEEFGLYKANRKESDALFVQQLPRSRDLLDAFNIPIVQIQGVEADDIIGTLVSKHSSEFDKVIIVTGDQDIFQLIEGNVNVFMAGRKFSESKLYDAHMVKDKLGISPKQVPDYKGICGDPSDNIPGVLGIGKKGASDLIREYGSVQSVYENIQKVAKRYQQKLIDNQEMAYKSLSLATIKCDIPLSFDIDTSNVHFTQSIVNKLDELDFNSQINKAKQLIKKYNQEYIEASFIEEAFGVDYWEEQQEVPKELIFIANLANIGADPINVVVESIDFISDGTLLSVKQEDVPIFISKLSTVDKLVTFSPKAFVHGVLNLGIEVDFYSKLVDIGIYACVLSNGLVSYSLEKIARKYNNEKDKGNPAHAILKIWQSSEFSDSKVSEFEKILSLEHSIIPAVISIERNGLTLDTKKFKKFSDELVEKRSVLIDDIYKLAGREFNINSPKQVGEILFDELKLPVVSKTKTGSYSTNENSLKKIAHEHRIVQSILRFRELDKLISTYLAALPEYINASTGRIHSTFDQMGAVSGRFSSKNPNLQNIPKGEVQGLNIRDAFKAREGYALISADYSQQELRILAALSGEQVMIDSFNKGDDIHAITASEIFNVPIKNVSKLQRNVGKTINFSVIYGISAFGLSDRLEVSQVEASMFINSYYQKYPSVKEFFNSKVEYIKQIGYAETVLGRRRSNELLNSSNRALQAAGKRELLNFVIQGSAADIMKLALRECLLVANKHEALMVAQIHDEFLFEIPLSKNSETFAKDISFAMTNVYDIGVAYKVDVSMGKTWGKLNELNFS